ncbi:MAG: hypothetical protein RIB60_05070 [Phycisphaerales bacterium]
MSGRRARSIGSLALACAALGACSGPGGRSPTTAARAAELTRAGDVVAMSARADARTGVISAEAWSFEGIPGQKLTTPSFELYTTIKSSLLLDRLPAFLEHALNHYTRAIVPLPDPAKRLETFVVATRPQWTRVTRRLMGADAAVYLRITRGGFAAKSRGVYYDIGSDETLAVAAHEGWHQYTQSTFNDPLPVWLEEGVATWMEGFKWDGPARPLPLFNPWENPERYRVLRRVAIDGGVMRLDHLLSVRPQDEIATSNDRALRYYAQVWAFTHFLYEGEAGRYRPALQRMLTDAATGDLYDTVRARLGERPARDARVRRVGPAVLAAYLPDVRMADLDRQYQSFVRRVAHPSAILDRDAASIP